jgi:hypothetical protein
VNRETEQHRRSHGRRRHRRCPRRGCNPGRPIVGPHIAGSELRSVGPRDND